MEILAVRKQVAKQLGFTEEQAITPALLNQADNIKLGDYVFAYVAANPDKFEPRQVEIAKRNVAAWGTDSPLLDTSFDWALFGSEVGNNVIKAGEQIAGIGQGFLSLASSMRYVLPVFGVAALAYIIWKKVK